LSDELGAIVKEVTENAAADPENVLHAHLDPLAERLRIMLGGKFLHLLFPFRTNKPAPKPVASRINPPRE